MRQLPSSRFASTPGLTLRVTFEVPADGEQRQAKADEARSGLKELGLDHDIQVSGQSVAGIQVMLKIDRVNKHFTTLTTPSLANASITERMEESELG
jgi:hypothetical protein